LTVWNLRDMCVSPPSMGENNLGMCTV
jgi:hypothetical protein